MPTRLRWYVGSLCVAGGFVLVYLMTRLDFVRAREVAPAIAVFGAFMIVGELVYPPGQRPEPAQGSLHHRHLRLRAGGPGRHRDGRAGVPPWLGHLRPGPAQGRHQDAVQRRPVRARPGRRRGRLPRPRRRLRDHHRHPAGAGGRRARLHADQLPAGQHRGQHRPGRARAPGAAARRPPPGAGQLGHGAGPGPGGGGGRRAQPAAGPGAGGAAGGRVRGLGGGAPGQGPAGGGRGGHRAPAPPHRARARGRPPPPGDRPAQGRPDRHRLPRAAQPPDHDRRRVRHPAGPAPSAQPGRA